MTWAKQGFPALVDPVSGCLLVANNDGLSAGRNTYHVIGGIPRLVPKVGDYASAFGDQWNRRQLTQLDSPTG
jgi:hypothetical protein